jgi:hypothetical protein
MQDMQIRGFLPPGGALRIECGAVFITIDRRGLK